MTYAWQIPLWLAIGYLLGSIPTGYWVVKWLHGVDIRTVGSGNTGTTNVKRIAGGKVALWVLVADMAKGFVPVTAVILVHPYLPWLHVGVALAAVIGHSKSLFLGFKGGKSAATGLGGLLGLVPLVSFMGIVLGATLFYFTRTVSIVSLVLSMLLTLAMLILGTWNLVPWAYVAYTAMAAAYIFWRHRDNITRLREGTENKL